MRGISPVNQEERYFPGGSGPSRVCCGICGSVCGHSRPASSPIIVTDVRFFSYKPYR